jgi:hypothetical protein
MSLSFALGMAVALGVYFLWRAHPENFQSSSAAAVALAVCPPFVLSFAFGPTPESDLALVLVVGTIVFANAFLYAGVAAGIYAVLTICKKGKG